MLKCRGNYCLEVVASMSKRSQKDLQELIDKADGVFADFPRRKESKLLYRKALKMARRAKREFESEYIQGKIDLVDEKWEESIEHFDEVTKIKTDFSRAWHYKGFAFDELGRYEEAVDCYDKALEINPESADTWNNKGNSLHHMEKYEEAVDCYDKALEINPENEFLRDNRNSTLMLLGRSDEAREEREKLFLVKKKRIIESELSEEEKEQKILEIYARKEVINELGGKYAEILEAKKTYEKKISTSLRPRDRPLTDNFFLVLRRWNSYTPVMLTTTESNLGGGYFLRWKGKGIVIDPGFDFLDNFFNNGLVLYDIDAVIISHAHVDHCSDFESLLSLIFEYNERNMDKKKIDIFMNLGAMKKFLSWIPVDVNGNASINRIYPLERGISYPLEMYSLKLIVTEALHDEVLTKDYSVGFVLELYSDGEYKEDKIFRIGYTSDTRHDEDIEEQYKGVDIIIPHLGSIDENDFSLEEEERHKNHLMLRGVISTIHRSGANLAIISEFGEELGEHRMAIVGALDRVFQDYGITKCLTGDIGLRVSIPSLKVKCHYCEKYVDAKEVSEGIDPENIDRKSVIYFCRDCERTHEYEKRKWLEQPLSVVQ